MKSSIQTAVAGVSGYAGMELARLLLHHPALKGRPPVFVGRDPEAVRLTEMHPQLADNNGSSGLLVEPFSWELLKERGVELFFMATPHEQSRGWVPEALEHGLKVVDLSAAWRLREPENRTIYAFHDADAVLAERVQSGSVYGLPELHLGRAFAMRSWWRTTCYATSIILALKPLVAAGWVDLERESLLIPSRVSRARAKHLPPPPTSCPPPIISPPMRSLAIATWAKFWEQLGLKESQLIFTPHLLPIPRGILSTTYVTFREKKEAAEVEACFRNFYASSPMVRVTR